jgi:hypothetical protein
MRARVILAFDLIGRDDAGGGALVLGANLGSAINPVL